MFLQGCNALLTSDVDNSGWSLIKAQISKQTNPIAEWGQERWNTMLELECINIVLNIFHDHLQ